MSRTSSRLHWGMSRRGESSPRMSRMLSRSHWGTRDTCQCACSHHTRRMSVRHLGKPSLECVCSHRTHHRQAIHSGISNAHCAYLHRTHHKIAPHSGTSTLHYACLHGTRYTLVPHLDKHRSDYACSHRTRHMCSQPWDSSPHSAYNHRLRTSYSHSGTSRHVQYAPRRLCTLTHSHSGTYCWLDTPPRKPRKCSPPAPLASTPVPPRTTARRKQTELS